ncbi:MAG: rRNA maturation RNase YbeY [Devosiaceae bacterium]
MTPALELAIEAGDWPQEQVVQTWFDAALQAACSAVPLRYQYSEISAVLSDDAAMRAINAQHRGQDTPTNVLSFPALEKCEVENLDGTRPVLLGDLVFAQETVQREAEAGQISLHHHMSHLIVHGFLHLLGYDHDIDSEAEAMETLETAILASLGIADPYRAS